MAKSKPAPTDQTSLTGDEQLDAIAGAMILLLSDLPAADQVKVLRKVTAEGVIVTTVNLNLKERITEMREEVKILAGYFDGSSGIGSLAAQNAKLNVDRLFAQVTRIRSYVE